MICEKCWSEAYTMMRETGEPRYSCYQKIVREKDEAGKTCTLQEQAAFHWDEETQRDTRQEV